MQTHMDTKNVSIRTLFSQAIIAVTLACMTGCVSLAASTAGTFIGNIASDRVLKEMDKKNDRLQSDRPVRVKKAVRKDAKVGQKQKAVQ